MKAITILMILPFLIGVTVYAEQEQHVEVQCCCVKNKTTHALVSVDKPTVKQRNCPCGPQCECECDEEGNCRCTDDCMKK